jgi:hypothetical protein
MNNEYILRDIIEYCDEMTLKKIYQINSQINKIIHNDLGLKTITLYGFDDTTCFFATLNNDLESLQFARMKGLSFYVVDVNGDIGDYDALKAAVRYGHLECLKYIIESECPKKYRIESAISVAISNKHFDCVTYLLQFYNPSDKIFGRNTRSTALPIRPDNVGRNTFCEEIVRHGSLENLKYLCEHNMPIGYAVNTALEHEKYDCVEYLLSLGYVPDAWKVPKEHLELVIQTIKNNAK